LSALYGTVEKLMETTWFRSGFVRLLCKIGHERGRTKRSLPVIFLHVDYTLEVCPGLACLLMLLKSTRRVLKRNTIDGHSS
jgi:hypothetical protein